MNSLRFLVTFEGDARTRWCSGSADVESGLRQMATTFARSYSSGSIPAVTVELLPEAAAPAASELKQRGGSEPSLSATDPAASTPTVTPDEAMGMAWWNGMTNAERLEVLKQADEIVWAPSVAQAWQLWKANRISMEAPKPS